MSALPRPSTFMSLMGPADVVEVMAIEQQAYPVPWTQGNFIDSLAAGYESGVLRGAEGRLLAYFLAMKGADEMHLLNLTVAPGVQGQGLARGLLDEVCARCRAERCAQLWLEVRVGNQRAREVYARFGFSQVGLRPGYYPALNGTREDAVLMSLVIPP